MRDRLVESLGALVAVLVFSMVAHPQAAQRGGEQRGGAVQAAASATAALPFTRQYRNGWRRDTVKPGMVVNFKGSRARNPESMNVSGCLTLPDGKALFQGQAPASPSN